MSKIYLKNSDELGDIIGTNIVKIGDGSEGIAFLSLNDNKVYKILTDFELEDEVKDIITSSDIDLKYFLLPEELYIYDNHLIAYRTKYVNKNLLDVNNNKNNIFNIDFDKFIIAYRNILSELLILSNNKIKIYDIGFNLMFDGENLYAIDTCGYRKVNENIKDLYEYNKQYLDGALKDIISAYLINDLSEDKYNELIDIQDLEEQLNEIKKSIKR